MHASFVEIHYGIVSTAILSLPLIQEGAFISQLLALRNSVSKLNDRTRHDLYSVDWAVKPQLCHTNNAPLRVVAVKCLYTVPRNSFAYHLIL